jgi:hypothetical protein
MPAGFDHIEVPSIELQVIYKQINIDHTWPFTLNSDHTAAVVSDVEHRRMEHHP